MPALRAVWTVAAVLSASPVLSPRLSPGKPSELLTILIPAACNCCSAVLKPMLSSTQYSASAADGAIWCTISATAVPCGVVLEFAQ